MWVSNFAQPMLGNDTSANGVRALRYRDHGLPARIFVCVPEWPGPFDIEIDCVAVI
jgi:2-iminobutanoate/2-iminopropanoate deaminase